MALPNCQAKASSRMPQETPRLRGVLALFLPKVDAPESASACCHPTAGSLITLLQEVQPLRPVCTNECLTLCGSFCPISALMRASLRYAEGLEISRLCFEGQSTGQVAREGRLRTSSRLLASSIAEIIAMSTSLPLRLRLAAPRLLCVLPNVGLVCLLQEGLDAR